MDRMTRPKAEVLPDSALVPEANLLDAPPAHFTHEVVRKQPYFYSSPIQDAPPDGSYPAGAKVLLLTHDGGPMCRVADARGVCAMTAFSGLRPLPKR